MDIENSKDNGAFLALLLPVRSVVFLLLFLIGAALVGKELADISNWWSVAATVVNLLTVGLIVLAAKKAGLSYIDLTNFRRGERDIKKTVLLVLGFMAAGMGGMYLSGLILYGAVMPEVSLDIVAPIPAVLAVVNFILLPATVSFAEDGLYLGCGVNHIKNRYAALAVPAFFYALQHCFIPTLFDGRYMLYRFLSFLPLTVIFCVFYQKKRDPLAIMISHALLDMATASMILMTSVVPGLYDSWRAAL